MIMLFMRGSLVIGSNSRDFTRLEIGSDSIYRESIAKLSWQQEFIIYSATSLIHRFKPMEDHTIDLIILYITFLLYNYY
jgi:hypothetical protein